MGAGRIHGKKNNETFYFNPLCQTHLMSFRKMPNTKKGSEQIAPPEHQTSWHPFPQVLSWIMSCAKHELDWRGEGRAAIATSLDYFLVLLGVCQSTQERGIKRSLEIRNWMILSVTEVSRELSYTVPGPFLPTGYLGHTLV